MLQESVIKLLNEQINKEIYSAYLYLDMANYYADEGLDGFEHWFKLQADEEMEHAMKFRQYLLDNGLKIVLSAIANPSASYKHFSEPLKAALEHERYVTASIHAIYEEALNKKDFRTMEFLNWFIEEQLEEETNAEDNIRKAEIAGDKGLFMLNREFGKRKED